MMTDVNDNEHRIWRLENDLANALRVIQEQKNRLQRLESALGHTQRRQIALDTSVAYLASCVADLQSQEVDSTDTEE